MTMITALAGELGSGALLLELDTVKLEELSLSLGVKSLPYFQFYKAGQLSGDFAGSKWDAVKQRVMAHVGPVAAPPTPPPPSAPEASAAAAASATMPPSAPAGSSSGSAAGGSGSSSVGGGEVVSLESEAQYRSLLESAGSRPVVVKFTAPWCFNCKKINKPFKGMCMAIARLFCIRCCLFGGWFLFWRRVLSLYRFLLCIFWIGFR